MVTILVIAVLAVSSVFLIGPRFMSKNDQTTQAEVTPQPTGTELMLSSKNTPIKTEEVTYFENVKGFYAAPEEAGNYPGVVMIHEWWGLNQNIKDMAKELAKEGYQVLAVDLYNGTVATTPDQAKGLTSSLDQTKAIDNMEAAVKFLKDKGAIKVASLGWCFGGGQSLRLAVSGQPLDATVLYYGNLITDVDQLTNVKWPVLGVFGDQDTGIPVESVKQFEKQLNDLKIKNEIYIYPGVGHAFANPSGANYAPEETKDAWSKTLNFLNSNLKG